MAIKLPQGLNITSSEPVDSRIVLTKNAMLETIDAIMPQVYLAICKDDGKLYIYNKNNSVDPETGKFRLHSSEVSEDEISVKLPGALSKALALQQDSDSGLVVDSEGNIKISVNQNELEIVNNKISFAFDIIESTDQ